MYSAAPAEEASFGYAQNIDARNNNDSHNPHMQMKQIDDVNENQMQSLYSTTEPNLSDSLKVNGAMDLVNDSSIASSSVVQKTASLPPILTPAPEKFSHEIEKTSGEAKYNEAPVWASYPSVQSSHTHHLVKTERPSIGTNEDDRDSFLAHNFVQTPQASHLKSNSSESAEAEHQQEQTYTPNSNNREQDDDDPDDLLS